MGPQLAQIHGPSFTSTFRTTSELKGWAHMPFQDHLNLVHELSGFLAHPTMVDKYSYPGMSCPWKARLCGFSKSGPWSLAPGPCSWSLLSGPWSLVSGPWSLAPGPWPLVPGPWPWSPGPGPWHWAMGLT